MAITAEEKGKLIDDLLFHIQVINPLQNIVKGLENNEFRAIDFDWLDTKRMEFVNLAVKACNLNIPPDFKVDKTTGEMNEFTTKIYLNHFQKLLEFFKTYE